MRVLPIMALALAAAPTHAETILVTGARVFDGTGRAARIRDVLVRDDRIVAVRSRITPPADARVIDGAGQTLLPGLHDLHIHTPEAMYRSPEALERGYAPYLAAGVTAVVNFSVAPGEVAALRALGEGRMVPHQALSVRLGVPGGHGTESARTDAITTKVSTPDAARAAMPALIAADPNLFKVFADGWRYADPARPDKPSIDLPTLKVIVGKARAAGHKVVTHTVSLAGLKNAVDAGVDAVVHGIGDAGIDDATMRRMKARRVAYVPTLAVYEPQQLRVLEAADLTMLRPADRVAEAARERPPVQDWDARRWAILQDNLRRLKRAGVRIGIGTDAGIAGVYHGWATQHEMRLFARFGFTPREALRAATSVSADILGRRDTGRIVPGMRADLILTGGRPDETLDDLRDVRRVFVNGVEMPIDRMRREIAEATP